MHRRPLICLLAEAFDEEADALSLRWILLKIRIKRIFRQDEVEL